MINPSPRMMVSAKRGLFDLTRRHRSTRSASSRTSIELGRARRAARGPDRGRESSDVFADQPCPGRAENHRDAERTLHLACSGDGFPRTLRQLRCAAMAARTRAEITVEASAPPSRLRQDCSAAGRLSIGGG